MVGIDLVHHLPRLQVLGSCFGGAMVREIQ